jgi:hypothetical protein
VDPDSLNPVTVPDPTFQVNPDPGPDPGFNDQKNKNFFLLFRSKIAIYFSQGLLKRTSKLQEKPSALKREHTALQKLKFFKLFSTFVGHFCPPGSNSDIPKNS